MPAFSYTSANIANLAAGVNASMADIQGGFVDLAGRINGTNGTLDETNVPNLSAAFTTYKTFGHAGSAIGGKPAGTYILPWPFGAGGAGVVTAGTVGSQSSMSVFRLDPSAWTANSRTTKMRLTVVVTNNAVAPAVDFTFGLYPVATWGGASGVTAIVSTLGTVITGSTVAVSAPPAAGPTVVAGSDFNAPSAGPYVIAAVLSGTQAAGNVATALVHIEYRQV